MEMTKVKCYSCGKRFYVLSEDIPDDVQPKDLIPLPCPDCGYGAYATIVEEDNKGKT